MCCSVDLCQELAWPSLYVRKMPPLRHQHTLETLCCISGIKGRAYVSADRSPKGDDGTLRSTGGPLVLPSTASVQVHVDGIMEACRRVHFPAVSWRTIFIANITKKILFAPARLPTVLSKGTKRAAGHQIM